MRQRHTTQGSIFWFRPEHEISGYLDKIDQWLNQHPQVLAWVSKDLAGHLTQGRPGMSSEQTLRAAIVLRYRGCSFRDLEFVLKDSLSFQSFCRIDPHRAPRKSALQKNISQIRAATWRKISQVFILDMKVTGVESGERLRIDSTVAESHILFPTDSKLLYNSIRLMVRVLNKHKKKTGIVYSNHCRRAKRRWFAATMAKNDEQRYPHYKALLADADETRVKLIESLKVLKKHGKSLILISDTEQLLKLVEKVMVQTTQRIVHGQQVPVANKVVSLCEPHTDIIKKGGRDVQFGHKLNIVTGLSGLVTDVVVESGNPADKARLLPMLKRHKRLYGIVPRELAADGGYASYENLKSAKQLGVEAVAFDKRINLSIDEMVGDDWLYRELKRFRAGIEASISYLKRCFGLKRIYWKGLDHFQSSVHLSILTHNLIRWAKTT
jgi:IS5 family transposase